MFSRSWLFVLGVAGLALAGCGKSQPLSERETAMEKLARHLASESKLKSAKVLVLSNPYTQTKGKPDEVYEFDDASVRGVERGFGEKATVKRVFPELKAEALRDASSVFVDPETKTPLSFLVAEGAFQKAIEANADCGIVISLIGLPANMNSLPAWSKAGEPVFGLLMPDWRMIGGPEAIQAAFSSGKLGAAIVQNPDAPAGGAGGAERFVLVTRGNASEMLASRPQLFGLR